MDNFEKEIIERLQRLETLFEASEERNRAEHQQIMAQIEELKEDGDRTYITNGKQNDRLTELETSFQNYLEEERREKKDYMWRFGMIVSIIVFAGDIVLRLFGF